MSNDDEAEPVEISRTTMLPMYDFCSVLREFMTEVGDSEKDDEELREVWVEVIQRHHAGLAFLPVLIPPPSRKIVKAPLSSEQD